MEPRKFGELLQRCAVGLLDRETTGPLIMTLFELHTNEGRKIVHSTKPHLDAAMHKYIQQKRAVGYRLSEIIFCWSPVYPETI